MRELNLDTCNEPRTYGVTELEHVRALETNMSQQLAAWGGLHESNISKNRILFEAERLVSELFGRYENREFMVVAGGPSKAKYAAQIADAKRKNWVIIAVDAAVPFMHSCNIAPDFVIGFDPQDVCSVFYRKFDEEPFWVFRISCGNEFVRCAPAERRLWYASANPFAELWRNTFRLYGSKLSSLREWALVTYSAVDMAYKLGAIKTLMVGNDLAEPIGGMCEHCGSPQIGRILAGRGSGQEITIMPEANLVTSTVFLSSRDAFGNFPQWYQDCKYYSMAHGLVMPGWPNINDLREAV